MRSRLREYREGRAGGGKGPWAALGRQYREAEIRRREARRAYVPPEDEPVEEEVVPIPEPVEELPSE